MRTRRAALSRRRGTLCCWPATVTPTSSVRVAFHCERRLRVFARDILRLGTAMVENLLLRTTKYAPRRGVRRRQSPFRIAREEYPLQNVSRRPGSRAQCVRRLTAPDTEERR